MSRSKRKRKSLPHSRGEAQEKIIPKIKVNGSRNGRVTLADVWPKG